MYASDALRYVTDALATSAVSMKALTRDAFAALKLVTDAFSETSV